MTKSNSRLKAFHALVLLFLCFVHLCFSNDMASLIALRKLLLQRKDVISTWFDSKIPPCNWIGIRCEGYVVHQISLSCTLSPLSLPFPRILREFRSLKHLNVSRCGFNGHIYLDFWTLEDLETLDLSDNRLLGVLPPTLSSLNLFSGDLPSSLGNLTKMLYLDASHNRFTGPIFPEIGNLKMLLTLDLSMNSLTGPIPETIGALTDVTLLNLQTCKITGNILAQISKMSSLTTLNIAQNYFEGGLPSSFGELTNLVYFLANSAGLSGPIPTTMGNCKKLRILNLSINTLSGPLPDSLNQ